MASTYEKIATTTVSGSSTSTITLNSISGSFTDLVLISNWSNSSSSTDTVIRFNNDSGGNYSSTTLIGTGSSASSVRYSNTSGVYISYNTGTADRYGITQIQNYSNTTTYKTFLNRGNSASVDVQAVVGLWRSTSAITRIDLVNNAGVFNAGSTFTLYGILKA
jgi:hypothetical protein